MTPTPLKALATACLFAIVSTPSDAARQNKNQVVAIDQHAVGQSHYGSASSQPGHVWIEIKLTKKSTKRASGQPARQRSLAVRNRNAVTTGDQGPAPVHQWGGSGLVENARRYIGMTADQIGLKRRTLWCATFLNHIAQGRGTGSDLARSWASKPRVAPQVGAVAVMSRGRRGGHVGVVSGFDPRGNPIVISGNHNRRVAESVYPRGRVYAYVMP